MPLENIYFVNREQVRLYLLSGTKLYINNNYWQITFNGVSCYQNNNKELVKTEKIDFVTDLIWREENCKVDLN